MKVLISVIALLCAFEAHAEPYILGGGEGGPVPLGGPIAKTICGANDMVAMKDQEAWLREMGKPVGIYRAGGMSCTGTLVSEDLFLTNRHCKASCSSIKVEFGYTGGRREAFACDEIVEAGSSASNQDYMLVKLKGSPGVEWGFYRLSDRELSPGDQLLMMHHPGAQTMKVSLKNCTFSRFDGGLVHHRCDTNPGSSGTGILVPDFDNPRESKIVAIHAFGGCGSSSTSTNSGPAIRHLAGISGEIKALID